MRWARVAAVAFAAMVVAPAVATAQSAAGVTGTADFRNAPLVGPGSHTDTIVTGDSAWYAVQYRNNDEFRIEVALADTDVDQDDDLTLQARFIGPTLGVLDADRVVEGSASYSGAEVNTWYVEVVLDTVGQLGIEHQLVIDLEGFQAADAAVPGDDCAEDPACTVDDDLAAATVIADDLQAELDAMSEEVDTEALEAEVADLQATVADTRDELAALDTEVAQLCAPEPTCTSIPVTDSGPPTWSWLVGGVLLLGGVSLFVLGRRQPA